MISPPLPRYRIYTHFQDYARSGGDLLRVGSADSGAHGRLEAAVCDWLGVEHAVSMPQNRVGIYFAVKALVRPGRKIILSPYTLSDVINMVVCAGAVPVFADIDRATCNIDPKEIEGLIDSETDAVLVTHLHGLTCDMDAISEMCQRHGLKLIEDAAQAFGSRHAGQFAGTFGDAGVYSFGMYKNITSFYGGMLTTPHPDVADRIRAWMADLPPQDLGVYLRKVANGLATDLATFPPVFKSLTYWVFRYAFLNDVAFLNRQVSIEQEPKLKSSIPDAYLCRMRPVQARIALSHLSHVESDSAARIEAAAQYDRGLADISGILLPPMRHDGGHIYTYYPIQVPDRQKLLRHLVSDGRDTAVQHLRNCADLDCFAQWRRDCPSAARTASEVVLLPTYPRYTAGEIDKTIRSIRDFYGYA